MPPIRTPLGERSRNTRDGKHLSPYQRGQVIGQYYKGAKPAAIATALKVHDSAVRYTLQHMELRSNSKDLPRAARKLSYSDRDKRVIIRYVRLFPKHTYKRLLKKHSITNWRCKKRPELSEAYTLKRLAWCLA
ncbi:hypothetical protein CJF31_00007589 [Rutstroemia sp. NJR-2017a BVV2]|nr:hypothetical protein CJF31_00007589 [Rutstroemia sp. NJR-2017a BVV2]